VGFAAIENLGDYVERSAQLIPAKNWAPRASPPGSLGGKRFSFAGMAGPNSHGAGRRRATIRRLLALSSHDLQRHPALRSSDTRSASAALQNILVSIQLSVSNRHEPAHATLRNPGGRTANTIFATCAPHLSSASLRSARNWWRWYTAATPEMVPDWWLRILSAT
jgi:hypothetical protein